MHTPAAALAWEFWRRHRKRLVLIAGLILGFALVYPKLCALAGVKLAGQNALDEFAKIPALQHNDEPTFFRIVQILYMLFLIAGPAVTMCLTLLCAIWMFTFTEVDEKTKDPMRVPARLFALPVSTSFLFWRFFLAGLAAVGALYATWVYVVPQPRMEILGMHQNCLGWLTLLALAQAIVWSLAAWPRTRMLALMALVFCFLGCINWYNVFELPIILPLAAVLAHAGLQKMRHGQWQGLTWKWPLALVAACTEWRGPKRFASPAQAQAWFEWRRYTGNFCFLAAGLALVPAAILLVRAAIEREPLSSNAMDGISLYLVFSSLLMHLCLGSSPVRPDQSFLMVRPLTNGQMILPMMKTAAISAALSWLAVLTALATMNLQGDFHKVVASVSPFPTVRVAIVLGLIFMTWRLAVVNLCFVLSGSRPLASMPVWLIIALGGGIVMIRILEQNGVYWLLFLRLVPLLLICLVAVKFLLAFLSFGNSLKRGLLSPDDVIHYLAVWAVLVVALLGTLALARPPQNEILPLSLGVVLLVPLARIGFCPIALAHYRHA